MKQWAEIEIRAQLGLGSLLFFFYSFSLLFSNLGFKFKFCTQFILKSYCEFKVQILEIFLDIYIIYIYIYFFYIISLVLIIIP
jgi:hypothetical protein